MGSVTGKLVVVMPLGKCSVFSHLGRGLYLVGIPAASSFFQGRWEGMISDESDELTVHCGGEIYDCFQNQ